MTSSLRERPGADLLHFTTTSEWERGQANGSYQPDSMALDGFVHLSFGHQVAAVATSNCRGASGLVLLVVDPVGLEADLRVEGGFPHLYRPIPTSSVRLVTDFPSDVDGSFALPDDARLAELALTALPSFDAVLDRCRSVMKQLAAPWWVGGGWAVDAAAGEISRPHLDVDLVVLRPDVPELAHLLASWDVRLARSGALAEWDGRELRNDDHQLWLRPDDGERPERWQDFAADPGFVEILVEQFDERSHLWEFRRNRDVRAPLQRLGNPGRFLGAEVALLYKAAAASGGEPAARAKAQLDFGHAVHHLTTDQRHWLNDAVAVAHGQHPWLSVLVP